MRTIAAVTVGRSDVGLYAPIVRAIVDHPGLELSVLAAAAHLAPEFGRTVEELRRLGWPVTEEVEMTLASDSPQAVAKSLGLGVLGFAQAFARSRPDVLLVMGDRFEMLSAVAAALPYNIPVAHVHGGETTRGAMDEAIRHAITKMAHIHFATTREYGRRILQMGEEPWRVHVTGSPAVDNIRATEPMALDRMEERLGIPLSGPFLLVTYHPVTLEYEDTPRQVANLVEALERVDLPTVVTYPNADTAGRAIIEAVNAFVERAPRRRVAVKSLGASMYYGLMSHAAAMVGNSSSGLIEAPSFRLPVVNVGTRQEGRVRAANVIDVGYEADDIEAGIRRALSPDFRAGLEGLQNPYGDGRAARRIVEVLATVDLGPSLVLKGFRDLRHETDGERGTPLDGER